MHGQKNIRQDGSISDELEVTSTIGASYLMTRWMSASKANPLLFLKPPFKEIFFVCIRSRT